MSSKLPVVSWRKAVRVFEKIGYQIVRQRESHLRLRDTINPEHRPLTIPKHKVLKPGLLRKLIRQANISVNEFSDLVKK